MLNLIDSAFAADAGGAAGGFDFVSLLPLVLIFVAFYFFLIRPQQKKAQQQREMVSAIKPSDQVITAGGIIGTVDSVEDNQFTLKVEDGTKMRMVKSSIAEKIEGSLKAVKSPKAKAENVTSINAPSAKKTAAKKPSVHKTSARKTPVKKAKS